MAQPTVLDVLIVYNGSLAQSAISPAAAPFADPSTCNPAYAYFLSACHKLGLRAGLSTSSDIVGAGTCGSYWTTAHGSWVKNDRPCKATQIFDKFSPKNTDTLALRHLLFSSSQIKSFSSYSLFKLFFDKQSTYRALSKYSIPTLTLADSSLRSIKDTLSSLAGLIRAHPYPHDFGTEVILKDRHGAGGRHIYKFASHNSRAISRAMIASPHLSFILQPLIHFDRGFKFNNRFVATDIRLIYLKDKIVSSYLRIAKAGDFRCNQHQGGSLSYITTRALPREVKQMAGEIAGILNKKSSLFTLDFLLSNSGHAYLLEGNTGPGLNWDPNDSTDQIQTKRLLRRIAAELYHRTPRLHPPLRSRLPSAHQSPLPLPQAFFSVL